MFRQDLENKLKRIFGVANVIFDSFTIGKEHDTLFCDIDNARDYIISGERGFIVDGRISICGNAGKNNYGWIHGKIELAKKEDVSEFMFGRNESQIKFSYNNDDFVKYDVDFTYTQRGEFNNIKNEIDSVDLTINIEE